MGDNDYFGVGHSDAMAGRKIKLLLDDAHADGFGRYVQGYASGYWEKNKPINKDWKDEDFISGVVDAAIGEPQKLNEAYLAGYICARKVLLL